MIYLCDLDADDARFCVAESGRSPYCGDLAHGTPALVLMLKRGDEAMRLELNESVGGLMLPDLVANIHNLLILRKSCAMQICRAFGLGVHEVMPAVLTNSKGRVHSADYVVVNPLGKVDCLDREHSDMYDLGEHSSVAIFGKFQLYASRIPTGRDLFRVKDGSTGYMFSERIVAFIRERGFTNFVFREIPLS